jgi:hypothetical protein
LVERRLSLASVGDFGLLLSPFSPWISICAAAPMLSSRHKKPPEGG